jgi:hypothetical protein
MVKALSSISSFKSNIKFFRNIILFITFFLILDQGIAAILRCSYQHILTGPGRYNYIKQNRYDCLIMGSSTSTCFYEDILSKELGISVLNIGLDGSALIYSRSLLEMVIAEDIKPDIIALNIDLFEPLKSAWSGNYYSMMDEMKPLYGEVDYIDRALLKDKPFEFIKYQIASYKYNGLLLSLIVKNLKDEKIYQRGNAPDSILRLPIDEKTMSEKFSNHIELDVRKLHLYEDFISVCKKNMIDVIFVESPLYYPQGRLTDRDRKIESLFVNMTEREHIPFIRITQETYPLFKTNTLFKDVLHLNHKGSIIFSAIFSERLKRLNIITKVISKRQSLVLNKSK